MGGQANTNSTHGSSYFDGSIQSTVSANVEAGFSIVAFSGNGTANQSVAHGLGATPKFIIIKNRTTAGYWCVTNPRFVSVSDPNILYLQSSAAEADDTNINGTTAPSSTVFGVDDYGAVNTSGNSHIAYCFTPIKNYSSMGTYIGNGSTNGPMIFTGMKPAFFLVKKANGNNHFHMYDNKRPGYNLIQNTLVPASNAAEVIASSYNAVDFVSSGVKIRQSNPDLNSSGGIYTYMCFASSPFTTSTGIPTTAV